ncbi:MAG: aspartate--tRNA ligase, partial [Clostridia bacterium]|nr:aspartate--tRNA ligase [Clostridia bacterium]
MAEQLAGLKRTCRCAELTKADVGKTVTVMGWVHARRDLGSLIFTWIRDVSGVVQAVFSEEADKEAYEKASSLRHEFVVAVTGELKLRDASAINPDLKTGEIEIIATSLKILNTSEVPPFHIDDSSDNVNDALRLTYRYLDLRRPEVQKGLIMRHEVAQIARNYFSEQQFMEIETPILTKSTPEGARDYLVPSRVHPGKFYALPQSPQLYKQLLMIAGMDRYFQLARCFRDEDLRADRQPEFTQIDLEMSFVEADDVISVNEGFIKKVFKDLKGIDLVTPFPRMCYREAMERYGSDKPDTRFGVEIHDLSDLVKDCEFGVFTSAIEAGGSVRCITAPDAAEKFSRKDMDKLVDLCKLFRAKGMAWIT